MEKEQNTPEELTEGSMVIQQAGGDYVIVAEGEDIKAHIGKVSKIYTENFDKTGMEWKLIIPFILDETEGSGQTYNSWIPAKLHPKSVLGMLLKAVDGSIPETLDPTTLEGKPVRVRLVNYDKDGVIKQRVDRKVFTKPASDQKVVKVEEKDHVLTDKELDEMFPGAETVK